MFVVDSCSGKVQTACTTVVALLSFGLSPSCLSLVSVSSDARFVRAVAQTGKACASVLKTNRSNGRGFSSEKIISRYLRLSLTKNVSILFSRFDRIWAKKDNQTQENTLVDYEHMHASLLNDQPESWGAARRLLVLEPIGSRVLRVLSSFGRTVIFRRQGTLDTLRKN